MMLWPNNRVPDGWFLRDGKDYNPAKYPRLFEVLGYNYGRVGNNFCVPNDIDEVFFAGSNKNIGSYVKNSGDASVTIPYNGWNVANGHGGRKGEGSKGDLIGVSGRGEISEYLESIGRVLSSRTFSINGDIKPTRRIYLPIIRHD